VGFDRELLRSTELDRENVALAGSVGVAVPKVRDVLPVARERELVRALRLVLRSTEFDLENVALAGKVSVAVALQLLLNKCQVRDADTVAVTTPQVDVANVWPPNTADGCGTV
jgi:hypothetical protein